MNATQPELSPSSEGSSVVKRPSGRRVFFTVILVLVLGCGITAAATAWWVNHNFYAGRMRPVMLNTAEQHTLEGKLQLLRREQTAPAPAAPTVTEPDLSHRTLTLSQKEINAYLAAQNLGDTVRVDLGDGRITATMIVPIPQDSGLPLLSGTTLRVSMVLEAALGLDDKPLVKLADVRVGGISLPNAWLGDIKGLNLVAENVEQDPGLQRLLAGVDKVEVRPGGLSVVLSE